jgi:hypothetical protein
VRVPHGATGICEFSCNLYNGGNVYEEVAKPRQVLQVLMLVFVM